MKADKTKTGNFSEGSIASNVLRLAVPMFFAELVHVLYNIVDRIYIGHMEGIGTAALTGIGVTVPLVSFIGAFANLGSYGGAPLCSIARGEGNTEKASAIQDTVFTVLLIFGVLLTVLLGLFRRPLLVWLGGDEQSMPYAMEYFSIYVLGTVFSVISLGMNAFINMQGFPKIGMGTVIIGAAANIVLDPVFIFVFKMNTAGAALATVLSQAISAGWAVLFFTGKKAVLPIRRLRIETQYLGQIFKLGVTGFCFKITNSLVQGASNMMLKAWGGSLSTLYIGSMSVINSLREVVMLPISAFSGGAQPILGYNYGAGKYRRVLECIRFETGWICGINLLLYACLMLFPKPLVSLFTDDPALIELCVPCLRIFFGLYFFMALQHTGQSSFVALNRPKHALFFSLFRKAILVLPLTLLLPRFGLGAEGVFWAEAISDIIGGTACFVTFRLTVCRELKRRAEEAAEEDR